MLVCSRLIPALAALAVASVAAAFAQDSSTPAATPPPAPAAPSTAAPLAPAPPEKLVGLVAWERLKGNTIEGRTSGDPFAEYFEAGGGVRYVDKDGLSTGTWSVQKNKVCFDFPEDDDRSCSTFEVTGDAGFSTDDDGSVVRFKIVPGNSKGL